MTVKRILICGLHQESNSFNPKLADFSDFDIFESENVCPENESLPLIYKGIFEAFDSSKELLSKNDISVETIGGPVFYASSGGPVDHRVVDDFSVKLLSSLKNAGNVDGIIIALHGATTSDKSEDVCGDIIKTVRERCGNSVLISSAFDLHANITEKIMRGSDYLSGYQRYPHLDIKETGYRAAERIIEDLTGFKTKTVRVTLPLMAPAHAYTTESDPLKTLMKKAKKYKEQGTITDYNIFQVQPWLDVKEMASSVVICAEDRKIAEKIATQLAKEEFEIKEKLSGEKLLSVEEIIQKVFTEKTDKPIIMADASDSPNAGACGDSAFVLEKLLPYKDEITAAVGLIDTPAVNKAFEVGVGGTADFMLGGTVAPELSKPVKVKCTVRSLTDGRFKNCGIQERGKDFCLGRTAVISIGKISVHIIERGRMGDPAFYRSFGIEPEFCDLISVKACTSFRAAYKDISDRIYNVDTPGAAGCVLTKMNYKNIKRPFYPFDEISYDLVSEPKCFR